MLWGAMGGLGLGSLSGFSCCPDMVGEWGGCVFEWFRGALLESLGGGSAGGGLGIDKGRKRSIGDASSVPRCDECCAGLVPMLGLGTVVKVMSDSHTVGGTSDSLPLAFFSLGSVGCSLDLETSGRVGISWGMFR